MDDAVNWHARAVAWELLALSFRYPQEELSQAICSGEWFAAAREVSELLHVELPERFDAQETKDAESDLHSLRAEATRLFVGVPRPAVYPYESQWVAGDSADSELMFVNRSAMEVERFCKALGFDRPKGTNEPLDHIAAECELLEYLALSVSGIEMKNVQASNYPGGSAEAAYNQFKEEHADRWMPLFAKDLEERSRLSFFGSVGMFLSKTYPSL